MSRWYDLAGGDGHPVGLTEARKPNWKPQGPVDFFGSTGCLVGATPAKSGWHHKSVEQCAYLPLCKSGHVGAHDPHSSLCNGTGEIFPQYA